MLGRKMGAVKEWSRKKGALMISWEGRVLSERSKEAEVYEINA